MNIGHRIIKNNNTAENYIVETLKDSRFGLFVGIPVFLLLNIGGWVLLEGSNVLFKILMVSPPVLLFFFGIIYIPYYVQGRFVNHIVREISHIEDSKIIIITQPTIFFRSKSKMLNLNKSKTVLKLDDHLVKNKFNECITIIDNGEAFYIPKHFFLEDWEELIRLTGALRNQELT